MSDLALLAIAFAAGFFVMYVLAGRRDGKGSSPRRDAEKSSATGRRDGPSSVAGARAATAKARAPRHDDADDVTSPSRHALAESEVNDVKTEVVSAVTEATIDAQDRRVAGDALSSTGPLASEAETPQAPTAQLNEPVSEEPKIPTVPVRAGATSSPDLPKIGYAEDAELEPTLVGSTNHARLSYSPPTQRIVYDEDAATDEPTHSGALILVTATAQTDRGIRRKRNEDSLLASEDQGIFVVADGMGGYRGGEVASQLAVSTIERAFSTKSFDGPQHDTIPPRASELARAIQMANEAIFQRASDDTKLEGMGTTICAARFSANKQRLYIGHVGDSRVYRMREGALHQMTSDHTMAELGVSGAGSAHLSRAVGVWPVVPIDIVLGKPRPGDLYLLCSDGLSKMVDDVSIGDVLRASESPAAAVEALIQAANDKGGKDNITVIVVRVDDPVKSDRPRAAA